ncbi:MAG: GTP 3',8-cyclase MoaA [Desulfovibrionaceae bacterium]
MADRHGRTVNYLRLSVTDRCNLACAYCAVREAPFVPHPLILRYEELLRMVDVVRPLGVNKVRFTGGEPFARKDFAEFVAQVMARHPDLDVRLTTNATLMRPHVEALARAGLRRVNISLDTLHPERFAKITGRDLFHEVLACIDACQAAGLMVKVNAVALKGVNDDELPDFLDFARTRALEFRLIEFMPMGCGERWSESSLWTAKEVLDEARKLAELTETPREGVDAGPARVFAIDGGPGRLGVISPMSDHFCLSCNRIRITADGRLRPCLFSERSFRLRPALRNPHLDDAALTRILRRALKRKPVGYELLQRRSQGDVCATRMSAIGG